MANSICANHKCALLLQYVRFKNLWGLFCLLMFVSDTCFPLDTASVWTGDLQGFLPGCHPEKEPEESLVRVPGWGQLLSLRSLSQQRSGRFERYHRQYGLAFLWCILTFKLISLLAFIHFNGLPWTSVTLCELGFLILGTRCDCVCPVGYSGRGCEITHRQEGQHAASHDILCPNPPDIWC